MRISIPNKNQYGAFPCLSPKLIHHYGKNKKLRHLLSRDMNSQRAVEAEKHDAISLGEKVLQVANGQEQPQKRQQQSNNNMSRTDLDTCCLGGRQNLEPSA